MTPTTTTCPPRAPAALRCASGQQLYTIIEPPEDQPNTLDRNTHLATAATDLVAHAHKLSAKTTKLRNQRDTIFAKARQYKQERDDAVQQQQPHATPGDANIEVCDGGPASKRAKTQLPCMPCGVEKALGRPIRKTLRARLEAARVLACSRV